MNESANEQPSRACQDEQLEALKLLKPRAPRLDWDAIRSVRVAEESGATTSNPWFVPLSSNGQRALAWWSGMVAGAAIMFCAMQWLVLGDLRAKIERLEQSTTAAAGPANDSQRADTVASDREIAVIEPLLVLDTLHEPTPWSVGALHRRFDRLVASRERHPLDKPSSSASLEESIPTQIENKSVPDYYGTDPVEPPLNRLWLQKELQRGVY